MRSCRIILCLPLMFAACDRDSQTAIKAYDAPKEAPADQRESAPDASAPTTMNAAPSAAPLIRWTVPPGWHQLPGDQMRYASFRVDPNDPNLVMTVVPLGRESAEVLPNINRWEKQLGLPPTSAGDLDTAVRQVSIGGEPATLTDLRQPKDAAAPQRTLAAMVAHGSRVWFFKLTGPDPVVGLQAENFAQFLHSIAFADADAPASAVTAPDTASEAPLQFEAPSTWQKQPPRTMRISSFFTGPSEPRAEIIISRLPADGIGAMSDNINRWRGQVGLPPLTDAAPQPAAAMVDGIASQQFDFHGDTGQQMCVVMTPAGSDVWFFKIAGPAVQVEHEQASFDGLVKSVHFKPAAKDHAPK